MSNLIDKGAMGVQVSWSFGDGDAEAVKVPRGEAADAFFAEGFTADANGEPLIPELTKDEALKRAVRMTARGGGRNKVVVAELLRPNKDTPLAFGVYLPRDPGTASEAGDDIRMGARVRFVGERAECLPPEGKAAFEPEFERCRLVGNEMARMTNDLFEYTSNRDISAALLAIGHGMWWISRRRNKGGVYYLQNGVNAERFVRLLKRVQRLTEGMARRNQFVPQITEDFSRALTLETWETAARDTFDQHVEQLLKALDEMKSKGVMRERTIAQHAEACAELMRRAEQYKEFLKGNVQKLGERLEGIRAEFLLAIAKGGEVEAGMAEIDQVAAIPAAQPAVDPFAARPRKPPAAPARLALEFDESMFDV